MKINGIKDMTQQQLRQELECGAKFVIYQYCISIGIMTFKRPSSVYFVPAKGSAVAKGLGCTATSLLLGWWGIPWGPIYTISAVVKNMLGSTDVTSLVWNQLGNPERGLNPGNTRSWVDAAGMDGAPVVFTAPGFRY
jgi:hypothetical protein